MKSSRFWSDLASTLAGTSTVAVPVLPRSQATDGQAPPDTGGHPDHRPQQKSQRIGQLLRRRWPDLVVLVATAARVALDAAGG